MSGLHTSAVQEYNKQEILTPSCRIRSDSQTTGMTLTTCVCEGCIKRRGASNMNIPYDVTCLLSAVWKVTLRSTCLGCLSWPGRRGVVYS